MYLLLLFLSLAAARLQGSVSEMEAKSVTVNPGMVLWSSALKLDLGWYALDDGVMGGKSKTNLPAGSLFDGNWNGQVSTENNGGFAGIRTKLLSPLRDASSCTGFLLSVTGDGQRYKFVARDTADWEGIAWSTTFDTTAGQVTEVKVPFSGMIPTKRASTVKPTYPFNKERLSDVQMTLSKFEYDGGLNPSFTAGPFQLTLNQISYY